MLRLPARRIGAGLIGALAVTVLHETARRVMRSPPRMDVLGIRSMRRFLGRRRMSPRRAFREALGAEVVSNGLYYALASGGSHPLRRGALMGAAAGIGGVMLPPVLGIGSRQSGGAPGKAGATVAYYLAGGLAAGAAARAMSRPLSSPA